MKILQITTVPQSLNFVRGFIDHLRLKGFEVEVLSSPGDLLDQFAQTMQVPTHEVEMPRRITPLRDARAVLQIWKVLRTTKPTIVHTHTPKGGVLGIISAWLARVPVRIYHMRGLPFVTAHGYRRALLIYTEKISCRFSDRVICISPSLREVALRSNLCSPDKIVVICKGGNGIDAQSVFNPTLILEDARRSSRKQLNIPLDAQVVGFVGRIVRDKGIIELAGAWCQLREEFPELHMILVGTFENQDPIPPEIEQQLREDPRIHLVGWVTENLVSLYAIMTICVLPSYREGFPNTPLEASAMSIPVVATQIPGCVDAVEDGITGTLVPPHDVPALVTVLRRYLNEDDLRYRHGVAGRERVLRDFKPEDIWEATYQEYMRLLEKHQVVEHEQTPV